MNLTQRDVDTIRQLDDLVCALNYDHFYADDLLELDELLHRVRKLGLSPKRRRKLFEAMGNRRPLPEWALRVGPKVPPPPPAEPDVPWDPKAKLKVSPRAMRERFPKPAIESVFMLDHDHWSL